MRIVKACDIEKAVTDIFIDINNNLPECMTESLRKSYLNERNPLGKKALGIILDNISAASEINVPICQDTGTAVIFAEIGQDVHIEGGSFETAVNSGVEKAYIEGYLRLSIAGDPIERINTETNTPAIIHTRITDGDKIKLTCTAKGAGSENMSALTMLNPSAKREDIIKFVVDTVVKAGSKPCPPIVVGIGIGGNFETAPLLAKKALLRDIGAPPVSEFYGTLEKDILNEINRTGIGPQGFGGDTTALAVHIENYAVHIASLPLAVNIGCHVNRHGSVVI